MISSDKFAPGICIVALTVDLGKMTQKVVVR